MFLTLGLTLVICGSAESPAVADVCDEHCMLTIRLAANSSQTQAMLANIQTMRHDMAKATIENHRDSP